MSRTFDVNGSGEQPPAGAGFDAPNGAIGDAGSADSGSGGDEFGATSIGGTGDSGGGDYTFDPDVHISITKRNANGTYRRKRQRKGTRGERTSSHRSKADISASIEGLSKTLMVIHIGLAEMTKTPELSLQQPESDALANSIANLLSEFDITPDPKVQAVIGLLMIGGMIYGPRMYLIRERLKNTDKPKGTVHHLRTVDNNTQVTDEPFAQ